MENPSCLLYGPGVAKIEDRQTPTLEDPNDVIVRIKFVGVCGSDVHFWRHGGIQTAVTEPLVMGHEASGIISSVGAAVTSVKVGDRVAIEPGHPCRRCQACKDGKYNLCPDVKFAAAPPNVHGTLTKFWKVPSDLVYKINDNVSLEEAVLIEPLAVAVHTTRLARVTPGQTVVITGAGTIGLLCAAVARVFGAHRIILLDIVEQKLKFASIYLDIETQLLDPEATPVESSTTIQKKLNLEGQVDTFIEASGAEASIQVGIYLTKPGGYYVQTGIGKAKAQVPMLAMSEKELHVRGCFRYGSGDFDLAVRLLSQGSVNLKPLISSVTPFERATEAWEKTGRGEGIKNLIEGPLD
ncbi:D-xylulose reductase [Penicillium sp. DV-2018c]|nr:D-xylulose reductase [Penicillium sp. DV-2018c]KAJ5563706.1 D-xylulose reductase [Penicillium sp. DV-2018c]